LNAHPTAGKDTHGKTTAEAKAALAAEVPHADTPRHVPDGSTAPSGHASAGGSEREPDAPQGESIHAPVAGSHGDIPQRTADHLTPADNTAEPATRLLAPSGHTQNNSAAAADSAAAPSQGETPTRHHATSEEASTRDSASHDELTHDVKAGTAEATAKEDGKRVAPEGQLASIAELPHADTPRHALDSPIASSEPAPASSQGDSNTFESDSDTSNRGSDTSNVDSDTPEDTFEGAPLRASAGEDGSDAPQHAAAPPPPALDTAPEPATRLLAPPAQNTDTLPASHNGSPAPPNRDTPQPPDTAEPELPPIPVIPPSPVKQSDVHVIRDGSRYQLTLDISRAGVIEACINDFERTGLLIMPLPQDLPDDAALDISIAHPSWGARHALTARKALYDGMRADQSFKEVLHILRSLQRKAAMAPPAPVPSPTPSSPERSGGRVPSLPPRKASTHPSTGGGQPPPSRPSRNRPRSPSSATRRPPTPTQPQIAVRRPRRPSAVRPSAPLALDASTETARVAQARSVLEREAAVYRKLFFLLEGLAVDG
ncbi:MAG: hypothetical protein AAFX99_35575, partial [Myxococcota bacterium]